MTSERLVEAAEEAVSQEIGSWVAKRRLYAIPSKNLEPHEYVTKVCVDCGEDLELFRKQKGRSRCVGCQETWEKKR